MAKVNKRSNVIQGHQLTTLVCGRCHVAIETTLHFVCVCVCVALAEFRFRRLGKHFMEPSYYDEIPLCKTLYFVRGTGLLAE
jgi:hypothetical protein